MPKLSETATSILTLLNNANELIVKSSDRKSAREVIKAASIYAKGKGLPISQEKLDNFSAVLIDARPYTLTMLIKDIAEDVVASDIKKNKANKQNTTKTT